MNDIKRPRGDTYADILHIKDAKGKPLDISGFTFKMTVDPSNAPEDNQNNLYTLTGTVADGPNGVVQFAPSLIQADQTPKTYYYDVQMTDLSGRVTTITSGRYIYTQDITK